MAKTIWSEKYRPKVIKDCILPDRIKTFFESQVESSEIQNMLLIGTAGTGKTTIAKALCEESGVEYLFINASETGRVDFIRNEVRSFASRKSMMTDKIRVVIFDECEGMSAESQALLRGMIEELSSNCRFIFTTNFANKIIDPIKSRCTSIDFTMNKTEKNQCIIGLAKRLKHILTEEGIKFDNDDIATVVKKFFPDFRKILNESQRNSHNGTLQVQSMMSLTDIAIGGLTGMISDKNFTEARKWVAENQDIETAHIIRLLYDKITPMVEPSSVPDLILILNKYDYQSAFVIDKQINIMAMIAEIMPVMVWR